jgi:hypothetical protein
MEDDWLEAAYEDRVSGGQDVDDWDEGPEDEPEEPDCPEFREDGSCIHSSHMAQAGLS